MSTQETFFLPATVQSVVRSRTNGPLISAAAELWIERDDLVVDVTYGNGFFWTHVRPERLIMHDLEGDGVDCRHLPEQSASVDVVVFDPPYIPQGGREHLPGTFLDNYGLRSGPANDIELRALFREGITEAYRVLRPGGRLLVKCMDYVNGRQFKMGHYHTVTDALTVGFKQVDEFVHYSGSGPGHGDDGVQVHSRRVHSFLCVFAKPKR